MPRSVWQDLAAIQGRTLRVCLPADNGPGREVIYPGILHPAPTEHLSYDVTDFLQVEGDMVLACPADLETNSAALRYVLRECGKENVFSLRPKVGEILTIPPDIKPQPKPQSEYSFTNNQSKPACAAAHRRLPTLYDTLDTAFYRERIHEDPPTYTGSRATRPLIGKPVSYPNEFAGRHWHSRGAA